MIRSISLPLAFLVVLGSFVLAASLKKASPEAPRPRILMIGDSLSVGSFGEVLQRYLENKYGRESVAAFASCGSSPENWLRDEPVFHTKCGYRERTPTTDVYSDFHNGRPPPPTGTPKLESLLARYKPTVVIVQQGTNWMDRPLSDDQIRSILKRFIAAVGAKRTIIWIGPPDSSRFSRVQARIYRLIRQEIPSGDVVINSRRLTDYVPGKTGGDGVHYNSASGEAWARKVIGLCDRVLPKPVRKVAASQ